MTSAPKSFQDFVTFTTQAYETMNAFANGYVSAATKSSAAMWQGIEDLTRNMGALGQETLARTISAGNTLMSAKTPQQAVGTHHTFIKDYIETLTAGTSKLSEISVRTAKDAVNPLAQHANDALGTLMTSSKAS